MATTTLPEEQIKFEFGGETFQVKYPDNGQIMDIEANKVSLSSGKYLDWLRMAQASGTAVNALNICDMVATLTVLVPSLKKRLRVESLLRLTPIQTRKLSAAFGKTILPWLNAWDEALLSADDDEETDSESGE